MNSNSKYFLRLMLLTVFATLVACGGGGKSDIMDDQPDEPTPGSSSNISAASQETGFITLPDGAQLKYSAYLPATEGRFPVIVHFDGYSAGSESVEDSLGLQKFLDAGYAVVGLNVRGTGCSTGGPWDVFNPQWGEDGAYAVDWLGERPWSTGKVGMWGVSFAGYMQLWVASFQPEHLSAIAPAGVVTDILRDVPRPGGVPNVVFPTVWWASLIKTWSEGGINGTEQGHPECLVNALNNIIFNQNDSVPEAMINVSHEDEFTRYRSANRYTHNVQVPTLLHYAWQDEQVGSRGGYVEETITPELLWLVGGNGGHLSYFMPEYQGHVLKFYDYFLKGTENGFEKVGRVQVWNEIYNGGSVSWEAGDNTVGWISEFADYPAPVTPLRLYMRPDGKMTSESPAEITGQESYAYPMPAPVMTAQNNYDWKLPVAPGGSLVYTTAPLPENLSFYGPASADLWFSSTSEDVDIQITITEVRPDGQEMYVQRGWLRASQRAQDPAYSTTLRPYLIQTRESEQPLIPGQPELLRVEINRFAHTFRKGSSIRMTVDAPSVTGAWGFNVHPTPAQNTVWHNAEHASSLVLGYLHSEAGQEMPACDSLEGQPCRSNMVPVPDGVGPLPPQ